MQSAISYWRHLCGALLLSAASVSNAAGQIAIVTPDTRPYDERLMRLSEILGAVHYLRELCGANDGQAWRDRMKELMDAEGSTALRRAKLRPVADEAFDEDSISVESTDEDENNQQWLSQGLERLPVEQRMALELTYTLGHSCEEVAAILDCPVNTVKTRLFRARETLKQLLPELAGMAGDKQ
jgi:uncharacterized protein (TIGR02301 family)